MSAAQVSSDEFGLKATTTQLHHHNHQHDAAAEVSNPTPVSRVITKESLRDFESPSKFEFLPAQLQRQVDYNSNNFGDDDEHSLQSSLFEFSLLDPDARDCDGELLALPLPLTSSSIDVDRELLAPPTLHNLDSYAALLSFDSSSIFHEDSDSTTATSSLAAVSTAAAIVVASQQQPHQQTLSHELIIDGSVPSLVAVYPDCSTSTTTTQPSALVSAHNKPKSKRTTTRGTGAGSSQVKSISSRKNSTSTITTTTRSKKNSSSKKQCLQLLTPQGTNSIMEQEPDPMATAAAVPSPPLPEADSTSASSALNTQKYTPPVVSSSQGGMVMDPTATSTFQYHQAVNPSHHHNHQAVANHHVPSQGGTIATRPRLVNMGDRHLSAGGGIAPSPRSSSASPSENNNSNHHHHNLSNTVVSNIHPPAASAAENTGRWTAEEHRLFLQGLEQHGKGWKKIATLIQSRTVVQIRTHAQKYFQKLTKAHQAGDGGVFVGGGGGGMVGGGGTHMISAGTAEGDGTVGIAIPLGPDGQPVVSMRTTSHATPVSASSGNNGIGSDSSSWGAGTGGEGGAGAMHGGGRSGRRASNVSSGGTKRRVIGNVVRSAVREGRNVKRQKIAELKRKGGGGGDLPVATPVADAHLSSSSVAPSSGPTASTAEGGGKGDHELVPNPLPSVSQILDPYMPPPPPPGAPLAAPGRVGGPGRQQLVHTATHGTLPMAALEDAVFRLLTPATGAPPPPPSQQQQQQSHLNNTPAVVDPLASQSNVNNAKVPLNHTQYPPLSGGVGTTAGYPQGMLLNYSPTGVTDMALLPSWVDAKNPPSWYNDGSDIDTLLEDADCLNWLSDTGDLDETYPPAMAEPAAVISSSSTAANSIDAISGHTITSTATIQDPAGGVFHPSTDSLSFLVDPPEQHHVVEDVNQLSSFLDEPPPPTNTGDFTYASATEAVEATTSAPTVSDSTTIHIPEHHIGESVTNLVGFPDLDMGDEQAFVSALLENSGPSIMSFPKLNSDLHICDNNISQENLALESGVTEEVSEGKADEYT